QAQVVRGRHGPAARPGSDRELQAVPEPHPERVREPGAGVRPGEHGRHAAGGGAAALAARPHSTAPGRDCALAPRGGLRVGRGAAGVKRFESYGKGVPGLELGDLTGWLIVVEGPDGVGRTTHVNRLRAHLERLGYAVAETGLTRSDLASRGIRRAKQGNTLGSNAFNLFYATDFADRLEQQRG